MSNQTLSFARKLDELGQYINDKIQNHPTRLAVYYSTAFFLFTTFLAWLKLFWFDEFITLYVNRFHSLPELWSYLKTGTELNPPLFHLLTRACSSLFGETAISLRLPAMIGFWVMSVCVFIFVNRRTAPLFAGLATLFTLTTTSYLYAYEARPYGIVLGCCGVSLVAWQVATVNRHRTLALVALSVSLGIAVSCHYYAGLLLVPLGAGELVRTISRRRLDTAIWATMLAGTSPILLYLPLIRAGFSVHNNDHVWNKPEVSFLWDSYHVLLGYTWIPLAIVLALAVIKKLREQRGYENSEEVPLPYHEVVAGAALTAMPVIGLAVASTVTNMITERYVLSSIVGSGILFAFSCWKLGRKHPGLALSFVLLFILVFTALQARNVHELIVDRNRYSNPELNAILRSKDVPITVKPLEALPFAYYAAPEFRSRIVCVLDFKNMYLFDSVDTPARLLVVGRGIFPVKLEEFESFGRNHRSFFIFGGPVGSIENEVFLHGGTVRITYLKRGGMLLVAEDNGKMQNTSHLTAATSR